MSENKKDYAVKTEVHQISNVGSSAIGTLLNKSAERIRRAREAIGYTHEKEKDNAAAWRCIANSYHRAADVLNRCSEQIPEDTRPFAYNAALSLELIFKAVLTKKKIAFPHADGGHGLGPLCDKAGIVVTALQKITLELMTEELFWAARYPVPQKASRWSRFHDEVFERHIVRAHTGNAFSSRANPETFPNWENYLKIWLSAVVVFEGCSE